MLTHRSACPSSVDWEPAWHGHFQASLWQCAWIGRGGWMEAWWRKSKKHLQSSHTGSGVDGDCQMPNVPTKGGGGRMENRIFILLCSLFLPHSNDQWPNGFIVEARDAFTVCVVLTVLMLSLMTGIRERHDELGSGLSALMFTLWVNRVYTYHFVWVKCVLINHMCWQTVKLQHLLNQT